MRPFRLFFILYALFTSCIVLPSQPNAKPVNSEDASVEMIPEGFENLVKNYTGPVTLYFNHMQLDDEINIQFDQSSKTLNLPPKSYASIINQTQSLLKPAAYNQFKHQLKKVQAVNIDAKHPYLARSEKKITLFFDQNDLKLYLLCPKHKIKNENNLKRLLKEMPPTTYHHMTLSNHLSFDYEKRGNTAHYPWALEGHLSGGKTELHYDANDNLQDYFNTFELIHYGTQYEYHAGYQEPLLFNNLMSNQNFWGVTIQEKPHLLNSSFYKNHSNPLFIQVNQSSQVQILHQGSILYDQILFPGQHQIQTEKFPNGAYSITIKKRDLLSNIVTESKENFNKNTTLYNSLYSGLTLSGGIQSRYFKEIRAENRSSYLYLKNGRPFKGGDLDAFYLLNQHDHQIGLDYSKQARALQYSTYGSVNQHAGLSIGGQFSYIHNNHSYQFNFNDQLYRHQINKTLSKQYQFTYQYHGNQIDYRMILKHSNNQSIGWYGGIYYPFKLLTLPTRISLNASYEKPHSTQILLTLSLVNRSKHNHTRLNLNYNSRKEHPNLLLYNTWTRDHLHFNQHLDMPLNIGKSVLNLDAQARFPQGTLKADADGKYKNHRFNVDYKRLGFSTTAINTLEGHALTHLRNPTGLITTSTAHNPSTMITVNNREHPIKHTTFIPLTPYEKHQIHFTSNKPEISISPNHDQAFLYPHHIQGIRVNEHRVCWVNFTLKTPKEITFQSLNDPDILIESNIPEYTSIPENTRLKFKKLNSDQICDTGIMIHCKKGEEKALGEIRCQSLTQAATAPSD